MPTRRDAFKFVSTAALPALAAAAPSPTKAEIDEYQPGNIKLSHRRPIRNMNDEDLLFLQQLGVRWARIEFGNSADYANVPQLAGDTGIRRAGTAYCIAYMRALLRRANEEVG